MNKLKKIIVFIIALFAIPFIIWNITFGFLVGYLLAILSAIGLYLTFKKKKLRYTTVPILIGFIMYILMLPITLPKMNNTTAAYQERISAGKHLNTIEKWNIYGQGITMSIVAAPLYPEVAKECLLMMVPDDDGIKEWESDFFMESKMLTDAFKRSNKGEVRWKQKHYKMHNEEVRVALALNICTYEVERTKDFTEYRVTVPCTYPKRCRSTMLKYPLEFRIEEGTFRYLVDQGWLFAYDAVWTHKINK